MRRLLPAFVALLLLAVPATAMGQSAQTNAPPGNSAIDEYLETVPGATGNQRPSAGGEGGAGGGGLTAAQRARLERLGPDGKTLAAAVDSTSPARATMHKGTATPAAAQGRSPLGEVLDAATGQSGDGGGMGAFLPGILLASVFGVIALVLLRRRSVS
jgi:Spy/CpxP family protein refolding chaperone